MTTTNNKNYANRRVLIKSKDHLDHVVKKTKMVIGNDVISTSLYTRTDKGLMICFEQWFDDDKDDWTYEYLPYKHKSKYSDETLKMEEIFIDLPLKSELNIDDFHDDNHLNELWFEYLASISESISELKPKDLAKDFYRFAVNKMGNNGGSL